MAHPTVHVLHFTDWSAGELRPIQSKWARAPVSIYSMAKCRRSTTILTHMQMLTHFDNLVPAGYQLKRRGQLVETGRFEWVERNDPIAGPYRSPTITCVEQFKPTEVS